LLRGNGWQPPSLAFLHACAPWAVQPACTRDNHPQGHAATARVMRPRPEEWLWRRGWPWPVALERALESGIADDPAHDRHAAWGDKPPTPCERDYRPSPRPPFVAACHMGSITPVRYRCYIA
jgi:hypothetical protein